MEINPNVRKKSSVLWAMVIILQLKRAAARDCTPGIPTPGYTTPKGEQWVKAGNELVLNCTLNDNGKYNSNHLFWKVGDELANISCVKTLDERTIQLGLPSIPESSFIVSCMAKKPGGVTWICENQVNVGNPPSENVDISCTSYNFANITCLWELSASNQKSPTNWTFSLGNHKTSIFCNHPKQGYIKGCTCVNDFTGVERPVVYLNGTNKWGNASSVFEFNHYQHVIMAAPTNLNVASITTSEALLSWTAPSSYKNIKNLSRRLKASINYRISIRKKGKEKVDYFYQNTPTENFLLQNLMPFTEYMITIQCRFVTKDYVNEWGFSNHTQLKTRSIAPRNPPNNVVANVVYKNYSEMNVTLYWTGMPEDQHLGKVFHYVIRTYRNGTELVTNSSNNNEFKANTSNSYFALSYLAIQPYKFIIRAANEAGESDEGTTVLIKHGTNDTLDIHVGDVTVHDLKENLWTYNVSWIIYDHNNSINTSLYWCVGNRSLDGMVQCNESGVHMFKEISNDVNRYILRLPNPTPSFHFFGVVTTQSRETQRIFWSSCTITEHQDPKPPRYHIETCGTTWVFLEWNPLNCEDKALYILGYYIYVYKPNGEEVIKKLEVDKEDLNYTVTDLTPDTLYKFSISTRTHDKESAEDLLFKQDVQTKSLATPMPSRWYIIIPALLFVILAFVVGYIAYERIYNRVKNDLRIVLPEKLDPNEVTNEDIRKQSQGKEKKSQLFFTSHSNNDNNHIRVYEKKRGDFESISSYDRVTDITDITDTLSMASSPTESCLYSDGSCHDSGLDVESPLYGGHFKFDLTTDEGQSPTVPFKGYDDAPAVNFSSIPSNGITLDSFQNPIIYTITGKCESPSFNDSLYASTGASEVYTTDPNDMKVVALHTHHLFPNSEETAPIPVCYVQADCEFKGCEPGLNKAELQCTRESGYAQPSIAMAKLPSSHSKDAYCPMTSLCYVLPSSSVLDHVDDNQADSETKVCGPKLCITELQPTREGDYVQPSIAMAKLPSSHNKDAYCPMTSFCYGLPSSSVPDQVENAQVDSETKVCGPKLRETVLQSTDEGDCTPSSLLPFITIAKLPSSHIKDAYCAMSLREPQLSYDRSSKNTTDRSYVSAAAADDDSKFSSSLPQQQQLDSTVVANYCKPYLVKQQPAPPLLLSVERSMNHSNGYKSFNQSNLMSPIVAKHR